MKNRSVNSHRLLALMLAGAMLSGCTQRARHERVLAKADKYFDAGQYSQAEVEYLNAVKLDNKDVHSISRLGIIYFEEGRLTRAYSFLSQARKLKPDDLQVRLKTGYLQLAVGDVPSARQEASAILEKDPKYPSAAFLLAETGKSRKDTDAVRQRLQNLVQKTGVTADSEVGFGTLAFNSGNFTEAQTRFTHALALDPNSVDAHYALGILQWDMNDLTNADLSLRKAAELSPPRSTQRLGYADFKSRTGALDEAKRLLTEMTEKTPDCVPAWVSLAELTLMNNQLAPEKRFDECLSLINQIQVRDPENYQSQLLRARVRLLHGQYDQRAGKFADAATELDQAVGEYERLAARYEKSPQVFYQLGVACLSKGDSAKALKNFNQAIELDPTFDDALLMQAQLNIQKDNADLAIRSMKDLIQRRPKLSMAYFNLAGAYAAKNDIGSAIETCRQLQKIYPDPHIPFLIGQFYLRQNKTNDARKAFSESLQLSAQFLPAMEKLVRLDVAEKNYAAALDRAEKALQANPNYPDVYTLHAEVLLTRTNTAEAESELRHAIELDPNYGPAYLALANLYVTTKKNDQALRELNQMLVSKPGDVSALTLIGMIQNQQGDFDGARATYEKLLALDPDRLIALNNLAYLYSEHFNQLDKAFEAARKARDLAPYDPFFSDTLGWIVLKRGDYPWALSLLQASADKLPDQPEVLYHLGMAYYEMADEVHAKNIFTRALAFNIDFPGRDQMRKRLDLLSTDFSRPTPEIVAALQKRIDEQSDDPVALRHLAEIYEAQGQHEKAAQVYEQVLRKSSDNPRLLISLARLYADHLNNPQKALDLAKAAYKLAPNDPGVAHTMGRLLFATGDYKWAASLLYSARLRSSDPELLYDCALAQYSVGNVSDAQSSMKDALRSAPQFSHAKEAGQFLELVSLAAEPSKAVDAAPLIQEIVKTSPGNVPALLASAVAAENRGHLSDAADLCEQILKLYPDFSPAVKKLAIYYADAPGKEARAYELAVKARDAMPDDDQVAGALGIISYRRNDFQGAVQYLKQAARNDAADGKSFYYLGLAQFKLRHNAEARAALQKAAGKNLPSPLLDELNRTLAQIK